MHYLTLPELLNLAERLGADEVRDYGLLESALARPQASVFGQDAYPDVWQKAAALMESLARNHALVDGNKRLSWYATWVFLHINGHPLHADFDVDEAERFVLSVCQGELDVPKIAEGLTRFTNGM
ncbi:type II toxin-antitoxin system death-on-curing family toxin [Streptomyces sp. DSM 41524]|uniref:Type II toxin-antitoxin system death-on-curing family toxin n=6 Tax=Streptomyces TaxID=1883 RepID=A0ABN1SIT5_9ACTN|nr:MULTISPECIES: type II toxin-antitoxin system death-on-curing family toxin [Streptomyces]MBI0378797.1 type II toxin-antitoxin system death-on-curing family toxin [Streptomyces albiflaviniger]MEE4593964.1 type II toxin-antitoxin system death-on-curing family toxin [Streptomyces sp. DSM 41524]EXU63194.1 death-on-curing protein [Streptomyces sp. PRh5]MCQ8832739.1 type II toxin-antitoxin system death-on-curing family toxin [Streptomyces samsunensis]NEW73301.1 type II toxin-antitoxin system death